MNCKQKLCLFVGILIFVLANSYAPWNYVKPLEAAGGALVRVPAGRYCIFDTPKAKEIAGLEVDVARVAIQSAVIVVVTLGLLAAFCECHKTKQE